MRGLAIALCVAGCSAPRSAPPIATPIAIDAAPGLPPVAPGLRLPAGVTPLGYELRLELDPDTDTFHGTVAIRVRLAQPTDHVWLHLEELEVQTAAWRQGGVDHPMRELAVPADEMRAFELGAVVGPAEITLVFAYTGHTDHDEEGLFRQQDRGHWYLYTQAESVFARRIVPCFDEPRFKVPWRVTLVVPGDVVALANTAQVSESKLADGQREVRFAETPPMPSYLLAVAVGPFALVNAGTVGRGHVPVRVAVAAADAGDAKITKALAGRMVASLEAYFDEPLPWPKLDFVAVPHFFGAMENPGLVTFERITLVGDPAERAFASRFARIAAHELAHQWLGNWVTPAWWDDLWLAEAFATWLGDKVATELGAFDDLALHRATAREQAFTADLDPDARPLRRVLATSADAETEFDAISYEKGAAVLAMFEQWIGPDAFRAAIRSYLRDHRGATAASDDLVAAVAAASSLAGGDALRSYLDRTGVPVVELALRCDGTPRLEATARGASIPVCVRTSGGRTCGLVVDHAELALAQCPAWVIGNAGGTAYYHVAWRGTRPPLGPAPTAGERLAYGDDLAAGVVRGDLPLADALAELRALAAIADPYARLAALAIARAIDPIVDDATRPRWAAWLGARFADRLTFAALAEPATAADVAVRDQLVGVAQIPAAAARRARELVDKTLAKGSDDRFDVLLEIATHDRALFDRITGPRSGVGRLALADALGTFGPDLASRVVELVVARSTLLPALVRDFARGETRLAAWQATRDHLAELAASLSPKQTRELIDATATLCDAAARTEVATAFAPHVARIVDGQRALAHSLALIDRCVARRANAGGFPALH